MLVPLTVQGKRLKLHVFPVPSRPFEKIGTDLFSIREKNYLITVDYHSHFFEIDYLPDLSSITVINKLKHHFDRDGILDVVSNCGIQYTFYKFKGFSREWHFVYDMSSPGNSKVAKNMMIKCTQGQEGSIHWSSESPQYSHGRVTNESSTDDLR